MLTKTDQLVDEAVGKYREILDTTDADRRTVLQAALGCSLEQMEHPRLLAYWRRVNALRELRGLEPDPDTPAE